MITNMLYYVYERTLSDRRQQKDQPATYINRPHSKLFRKEYRTNVYYRIEEKDKQIRIKKNLRIKTRNNKKERKLMKKKNLNTDKMLDI